MFLFHGRIAHHGIIEHSQYARSLDCEYVYMSYIYVSI